MRAYVQAYEASSELYPGEASHPDEVRERCAAAEEEVHDRMRPSGFEVRAYVDAAEAFRDWSRYGRFPYEGGLLDQPRLWKLGLDCMHAAQAEGQARASWEAREDTEN